MYRGWEYKIEHRGFTGAEEEAGAEVDCLNKHGNEGWELVSSTVTYQSDPLDTLDPNYSTLFRDSTVFKYVFKRLHGWESEIAIKRGEKQEADDYRQQHILRTPTVQP